MIRIACCDDDPMVLREMTDLLGQYVKIRCGLEWATYGSALDLIAAIEQGHRWDILLLDIVMPGENGIDLAREIRTRDGEVKIIFLTSSPEFAVQSYTVGAYYYLLKPVTVQTLFPVLDRAMAACTRTQTEKLILKCKNGLTAIAPEKLSYCEVWNHTLLLHLSNGRLLESKGKMDALEEQLRPFGSFLRIHRSYLVNMEYIQSISSKTVTLICGTELPLPHGKYSEVKKVYLAYASEAKQTIL